MEKIFTKLRIVYLHNKKHPLRSYFNVKVHIMSLFSLKLIILVFSAKIQYPKHLFSI